MNEQITISALYDLNETIAADIFKDCTYPWEVLAKIGDFIKELGKTLPEDEYEQRAEDVWVAKSATVYPTAYINGPFSRFIKLLETLNYKFCFNVLNAVNYGVPQNRKRLVLLASKKYEIKFPDPKYGEGLRPFRVVRDAIGKYPPINQGTSSPNVQDHEAAKLSDLLLQRISVLKPGEDRRSWPDELKLQCHMNKKGHTDVYGRLDWDKPSVTLTTKCISLSNGRFGHPTQNRALSAREAAAIQTFPDDFTFVGSVWEKGRQIGNAVPVLFAKELGKQIIEVERENTKWKSKN